MKLDAVEPRYVEFVPKVLEPGVLYVSEKYKTASHLCACGCGEKVVTPLSPAEWQLRNDGGFVSLHPSIGNWNYACRSHYWIRRNRITWSGGMTRQQIERVQARDRADKARYVAALNREKDEAARTENVKIKTSSSLIQWLWTALQRWWRGN
ncbi:DUF6527 family protein [Paraburkholderia sp. BL17N1]|uniref:DUF6527 family protein n=1 Tax=Paraburkholderia sp. BL17N1 TaxID=1938798 RepID=UPI000EB20AFC|nr:DUF6527 family protein [Paraburkholderia sp. BL17N1]RKR43746.1 hypothetical protein B0G82_1323 [Paraburkholderia sp. BL17N1]